MAGELVAWIGCALLVSAAVRVEGETCTVGADPCQCNFADGDRYLDLNPIKTAFTTPFSSITGEYSYVYGPCGYTLDQGDECTSADDVAVCQNAGTWFNIGEASLIAVDVDSSASPVTSVWTYTGGSGGRQTHVTISCREGTIPGSIQDSGENPTLNYNLAVDSGVGCIQKHGGQPGTTPPRPPGPTDPAPVVSGISAGSICTIIFFVSGTVYLVGGILLMRFHRGSQGIEMIPNRGLWFALPGLIKDGAFFIVKPCRGSGGGGSGEYESLSP